MKSTFVWACIFGATGIALGALGAHALKSVLNENQLASFEVGVRYQMYHAFFLLVIGILQVQFSHINFSIVKKITIAGVILFSVSIYTLSLQQVFEINASFLGPVTPLGGILLISAWVILFIKMLKPTVN